MSTKEDLMNRVPEGVGVTVQTLVPTEQDVRVLSASWAVKRSGMWLRFRHGACAVTRWWRPPPRD